MQKHFVEKIIFASSLLQVKYERYLIIKHSSNESSFTLADQAKFLKVLKNIEACQTAVGDIDYVILRYSNGAWSMVNAKRGKGGEFQSFFDRFVTNPAAGLLRKRAVKVARFYLRRRRMCSRHSHSWMQYRLLFQ